MAADTGCVRAKSLQSCPPLCEFKAVTYQASLSVGFSRQEYWSGLPYPPPRDLPDPGTEPVSLKSPVLAGRFFTTSTTWEAQTLATRVIVTIAVASSMVESGSRSLSSFGNFW